MRLLIALFALLVLTGLSGAESAPLRALCEKDKTSYVESPKMLLAAQPVYGQPLRFIDELECDRLEALLEYRGAAVLVATKDAGGNDCHACGAILDAHVMRASGTQYRVIKSFPEFTSVGTFGNPGTFRAVRIGGNDAFAIEHGGLFQGYHYDAVSFYHFRGGDLSGIRLKPSICLSAGEGGAGTSVMHDFNGSWRIDPRDDARLIIDFRSAESRARLRTEWRLEASEFALAKGNLDRKPGFGACP